MLCPHDWYLFNGHCYYSSSDSTSTYDVATAQCQEANILSQLASVQDVIENNLLSLYQTPNAAFIGLKRFDTDSWMWSDGSRDNYTNWSEGQPGDGDCAVMHLDGGWTSKACDKKAGYHCKLKASSYLSCPLGWQLFSGFCYLAQDEPLSWEDARSGCNMRGGDLVSVLDQGEQAEIMSLIHSGPECPENYQLVGGQCYYLVTDQQLTWDEAETRCKESDAHLAIIKNKSQMNNVMSLLSGNLRVWIGLSDKQTEGTWKYTNGGKLGNYNAWGENEPNGGEAENCAEIRAEKADWNDKQCNATRAFICSKGKGSSQVDRWLGLSDRASPNSFHWSDNSYVSFTNWGAGYPRTHGGLDDVCVYMDSITGGWLHTFCHDPKASVCKTNQEITSVPPDHYGCTADQVAYRGSCYQVILSPKSFDAAHADCVDREANLVTITSEYEQAKITTIIAETGQHFILGTVSLCPFIIYFTFPSLFLS